MFSLSLDETIYHTDALIESAFSAESHPALRFCQSWLSGQSYFTLHTSGSTGAPKPIELHRDQMTLSAQLTGAALGLQAGDRALVGLSTHYIAGVMMLVRGMELGLALTVVEPQRNPLAGFSAELVLGKAEVTHFDFTAVVPLQMQAILAAPQRIIADQMKAILIGGAAVNATLLRDVQTLNAPVYHSYGMTETVSHIALRRLNGPTADNYFTPLPGVHLRVDQRDCLTITAALTRGTTVVTNDRVELLPDGRFRWLGRVDNVINSGGHKVQAEQVEAALHAVLGENRRLLVAGVPDETLGERVVAVIEGVAWDDSAEIDLQNRLLGAGLHRYELPRRIVFMTHFPETETGKIDRRVVQETLFSPVELQP